MDGGLAIGYLESLEEEDREAVGRDQTVDGEDLEHLQSGDQGATALTDDVTH